MTADLHIHTDYSDGKNTPQEIVEMAVQMGLQAVAITDHESLEGIGEAQAVGQKLGLEIVPGVEISTIWGAANIHILGYWLDLQNSLLLEKLAFWQEKRIERVAKMIAKLQKLNYYNMFC
ncbi:MAG: PHP domain-containing protein [Clostridia bacterium]|nr:PHP domain-containing protein [Clostridia bacterium]